MRMIWVVTMMACNSLFTSLLCHYFCSLIRHPLLLSHIICKYAIRPDYRKLRELFEGWKDRRALSGVHFCSTLAREEGVVLGNGRSGSRGVLILYERKAMRRSDRDGLVFLGTGIKETKP